MLTITRALAKRLRSMFRQALATSKRDPLPAIEFSGGPDGLCVRCRTPDAACEFRLDGEQPQETLLAPWELLCDCQGTKEQPVQIQRDGDGVIAFWQDGAVPRNLLYDSPTFRIEEPWPTIAGELAENRPELLQALADAAETAGSPGGRFTLDHIQLQGETGKIVATDARQGLIQGGFQFPWSGEILLKPPRVLTNKRLPHDQPVFVGAGGDWFRLRVGPWTFSWKVNKSARFPVVEEFVGDPARASTTLDVAKADRAFLSENLPRLPDDLPDHFVTVDLNGAVAVRAKARAENRVTELVLRNSSRRGRAVRLMMDRQLLARSLDLGFSRFHAFHSKPSFLAIDETRQHIWVTAPAPKPEKNTDTIKIESPLDAARQTPQRPPKTKTNTMNRDFEPPNRTKVNPQPTSETRPSGDTLADVLEQAGILRGVLRDALSATGDLIRSLKQDKKRRKAVESTLASLEKLQKTAG